MKEMVYKHDWNSELLEYNTYKGYNYAVVSQGVFPCGYVEIPKDHPYYQKSYGECDISCHGGLTFSGQLGDHLNLPTNTFWLGWDYGHYGDLMGFDLKFHGIGFGNAYTTEDVVCECKKVIEQLEVKNEICNSNNAKRRNSNT